MPRQSGGSSHSAAFVHAFDLVVDDPQMAGMGRGEFSADGFLAGWNAGNRFAHGAIVAQHGDTATFHSLPEALPYPARLGRWPAAAGLLAFAWFELVSTSSQDPSSIAIAALVYAALQLIGMSLYGVAAWERDGDGLGVLDAETVVGGNWVTGQSHVVIHVDGSGIAFDQTRVMLNLVVGAGQMLDSRAQARRVAARLPQFKRAEVDFAGVTDVGHAFADELFRVFARAHQDVELVPLNMTPRIAALVQAARKA